MQPLRLLPVHVVRVREERVTAFIDALPQLPPGKAYTGDLQILAERVNGFVYAGDRLSAVLDAVRVLRGDPELAARLLALDDITPGPTPKENR